MTATSCRKCGYKHTDVLSLEKREPTIVKAKIRSPADLDIKVVKSGTATIKIPEFGATITPGPYSEGFISNVEGVLDRVEDALIFMLSSVDDKCLKKGERIRKQIQMSKEKPHFTLILEDPLGSSALVASDSSKIQKRKLTKRELQRVKFGQYALDSCSVSK
jgi:zinc finger protein